MRSFRAAGRRRQGGIEKGGIKKSGMVGWRRRAGVCARPRSQGWRAVGRASSQQDAPGPGSFSSSSLHSFSSSCASGASRPASGPRLLYATARGGGGGAEAARAGCEPREQACVLQAVVCKAGSRADAPAAPRPSPSAHPGR